MDRFILLGRFRGRFHDLRGGFRRHIKGLDFLGFSVFSGKRFIGSGFTEDGEEFRLSFCVALFDDVRGIEFG